MKKLLLLLILFGLSTDLYAQRPQGGRAGNFTKIKLEGLVTDKETQEPLEYATISLVNERFPERIQGGITDTKGKFNLEVFPGKYDITIE